MQAADDKERGGAEQRRSLGRQSRMLNRRHQNQGDKNRSAYPNRSGEDMNPNGKQIGQSQIIPGIRLSWLESTLSAGSFPRKGLAKLTSSPAKMTSNPRTPGHYRCTRVAAKKAAKRFRIRNPLQISLTNGGRTLSAPKEMGHE